MSDNENTQRGLYNRYTVSHADGTPTDASAEYFVLRLDAGSKDPIHLTACRSAIQVYAWTIQSHLPLLAADLFAKYGKPVPVTLPKKKVSKPRTGGILRKRPSKKKHRKSPKKA